MDLPDQQDRAKIGKREASGGRILVKFKLSKPASELSPSPEINPAGESSGHRCKVCGKSFISGNSLGGHMSSAHVQSNKDYSFKKLNSSIHKEGQTHNKGSGLHVCRVCGRGFPSERSLYGHMRCHPEREWRGMDPTSGRAGRRKGLEYSGPEETFGFAGSFMTWSVKAKRGRPDQSLKRKGDDREIQTQELIKRVRWNTADDDVGMSENGNGESESESGHFFGAVNFLANGLQRRKCEIGEKNVMFDQLLQSDNLHVCLVCEKGFRTRQALGWHRKICSNNKVVKRKL